MDHSDAVKHLFVEQYLLEELSAEQRDEFEEHFFDCQECAADLRETSVFLQSVRDELRKPRLLGISQDPAVVTSGATHGVTERSKLTYLRPVLAFAALAACLMVMAYQNIVTFPKLRNEVASLEKPEVLPSLSLAGANSRSGKMPSASSNGAHSILLQIDIPSQARFSSYSCSLYSPDHRLIWTAEVSAQAAMDTVFLRAPLLGNMNGVYSLNVRGNENPLNISGVDLATYPFTINASDAGAGHQDKFQPE